MPGGAVKLPARDESTACWGLKHIRWLFPGVSGEAHASVGTQLLTSGFDWRGCLSSIYQDRFIIHKDRVLYNVDQLLTVADF